MGATRVEHGADAPGGTYRLLFEEGPQPLLIVDAATLRVLRANKAAAATYGYALRELFDMPLSALWPRGAEVLSPQAVARRGGEDSTVVWRHFRKDGEPIEVHVFFHEAAFASRPAVALYVREITELAFSIAVMEAQRRLLEMVARAPRLELVLEELVLSMERLSGEMIGSVLLVDEAGRSAHHGAAPSLPQQYWREIDGLPLGPGAGSCGTAMFLNKRVIVEDIATDPLWTDYRAHALPHGLNACWSTPIRSRVGKVLGAFAMYYRRPGPPPPRDLSLVDVASHLAALAIERDRADRALQEGESRLRAFIDHALAAVSLKDVEGRYVIVNQRFEQVTGIPATLAVGRTDRQLFKRALADVYSANDREVLQAREGIDFEEEIPQPDGVRVHLAVKFPLLHAGGAVYGIGAILCDITERKRAERALERSREELRVLAAGLQSVREEERTRISREIHDELGQMLTSLHMSHSVLARSVSERLPSEEWIAVELQSMRETVADILAWVRRIATELRPQVLDKLGLAAAVKWQAAEFSRRTGIACRVLLPEASVQADTDRSTALFRLLQAALTNVARHAGATEVVVALRQDGPLLEMTVTDNGRGIQEDVEPGPDSLGLLGMRERAAALGGTIEVAKMPAGGTRLAVRIPAR